MMAQVSLNQPAPDFNLTKFTGQPFVLSDFRGRKHVLLVFNRGFI
jgi:peroxiredoxin